MKVTQVTLKKNFKVGLPNYSNMDVGITMTWDIEEGEQFNFDKAWDILNQQIAVQATNYDPSWIQTKEYKDKYKAIVNMPKQTSMKGVS